MNDMEAVSLGLSIRQRPGGKDRIDDLAQRWLDGDTVGVLKQLGDRRCIVMTREPCQIFHLRTLGLKISQIAEMCKCSERTVLRRLRKTTQH